MKLRTKRREEWITVLRSGDMAEFLVRPLTPKEVDDLVEKSTEITWERNQRFKDINWYLFKISKIDAQIIDWKGIENEDGSPIPCNRETKESVFLFNPDLIDEVLDKADRIAKAIIEEKEGLEKNLSSGRKGSQAKML